MRGMFAQVAMAMAALGHKVSVPSLPGLGMVVKPTAPKPRRSTNHSPSGRSVNGGRIKPALKGKRHASQRRRSNRRKAARKKAA